MPTEQRERLLPVRILGRELDLIAVKGRLRNPGARLVTVVGPGGVGKSRLAEEAARATAEEFPGGVRALDLTSCDPDQPQHAVAALDREAVGLGSSERALLLLDGVEHQGVDLAAAVADLFSKRPHLTVLATGQHALGIHGEHVVPLTPLDPPGPSHEVELEDVQDNPAVRLFTQRAHEVNPEFALTPENVADVVAICHLLEGVPLALELAAARLRLFPVRELRTWLERDGDLHQAGPVDLPERQRSTRAMAEWSCRGLSEHQRAVLWQLAYFRRGATLAAIERTCALRAGETLRAVEALLEGGLVSMAERPRGETRITMSRTLRAYALAESEEAGRAAALSEAHARWYVRMMRGLEGRFHGSEQQRWLRSAEEELDDVRGALEHLRATGDLENQAALLAAVTQPWLIRGDLREGLRWFDETAEALRSDEREPVLRLRARLYNGAGRLASERGDHDGAAHRFRRAVALYKRLREAQFGARASARMGLALVRCGDRAVGQSLIVAARTALESLGDTHGSAGAAVALAEALAEEGHEDEAAELLDRAVRIYRQNGEIRELAAALLVQATAARRQEDDAAAEAALRESLRLYDSVDDRTALPAALEAFADLIRSTAGQPQRAVRLFAAAEAMRRRSGAELTGPRRDRQQETLALLRRQLGWTVYATVWTEGLRLPAEAVVAEALSAVEAKRGTPRGEAGVLTPRQLQVALLVAEGLTNRQIASKLDIAEWTVVNHVRFVMRKLGCNSRVQVAWAVGRRK